MVRRGRSFWIKIGVLAAIILIPLIVSLWVFQQLNPSGSTGKKISVGMPAGASDDQIVRVLTRDGVVTSPTIFGWYAKLRGMGAVPAGKYEFKDRQAMAEVVATLRKGPRLGGSKLTLPEGLTLQETASHVAKGVPDIDAANFAQVARSGAVRSKFEPPEVSNLEGYLYPDTYQIAGNANAEDIIRKLVTEFDTTAGPLGIDKVPNFTPYQLVTIASLIESEARVPQDRPKIARVIFNRLAKNMRLQVDAAFLYTKPPGSVVSGEDLKVDGPYNTYTRPGLPPTPISNPGRASLEAAIHPADGPWLYYVKADANGTHAFTDSYDEFVRQKQLAKQKGLLN